METSYNLLETTLEMFDAMKYLPNFKKFGIDSSVLQLLTDDDLKIIGVDDEQLRSSLIKQYSNIPLLTDSKLNVALNEKYLMTVLHEVDNHLLMLDASLTYALMRKDTQRCDVKLHKASRCLVNCADSMYNELRNFHYVFAPKSKRKINKWKIALLTIISATATTLVFRRYITTH